MEHATTLLEQTLAPPPRQPDLGEPGFWRDFLWGMLKPAAATAVVALAVMLSFTQRLGIEAEMIYGVARSFVQLSLVGFVLHFIFVQKNATPWILLTYLFMARNVTVASYTAGQRAKQVPRGKYIAFVSILLGTVVNMALLLMLDVFPFTPRYIIPAAGMMVSNAMNVTGVTMKKLRDDVKIQKNLVETALALGASPREATLQQMRRSLGIALSPAIDNAKTQRLINLPGAMTGLIMAGASPLQAVQVQIVLKNVIMAASTVSGICLSYLCWPAFFTEDFQLKEEHATALLEQTLAPPPRQPDLGEPGFWRDFLVGMLKPAASIAVVALAVMLSFTQRLGVEGETLYAVARSFVQLLLIGFVLHFIFIQKNATPWILLTYLFMAASYTAGKRAKQVPRGKHIAFVSILVGTGTTMILLLLLKVFPFTPQYIIPISGMVIGNAMTVTGVAMKQLQQDIKTHKNLVEMALALGATPRQATLQQIRTSQEIALSPGIDNAKTQGVINLPGAMTGLIMAGASPLEAIQVQIVLKNMLMAASTVSSIVSSFLCWPAFFTKTFQLKEVFAE
uniref:UPF0014 membrane protein STAR2 n=1 Tax=Saccharum spontaneum TaxID=62335 RepID=A0A678THX3_SACSP|nr:UPF0014 membrane protein STAR2 [Saccharum spontaneum]